MQMVESCGQVGQADLAEARDQQRFGFVESGRQRLVDGLFDQAAWLLDPVAMANTVGAPTAS